MPMNLNFQKHFGKGTPNVYIFTCYTTMRWYLSWCIPPKHPQEYTTSGNNSKTPKISISSSYHFFAILVGSVHCLGWQFQFLSYLEKIVWCVCSMLITAIPALLVVYYPANKQVQKMGVPHYSANYVGMVMLPCYTLARAALLIEAFIVLRNIPEGAFVEVKWIQFLPHI